MSRVALITTLVALVALLGQGTKASKENAVDIVTTHGKHLVFPYFENFKTIDQEVRELVVPEVSKIVEFLAEVTYETLDHQGKRGIVSWAKVGWDLWGLGQEYAKKRKRLGKESGTSPRFNVELKALFEHILSESHNYEKQLKASNAPKNYEQMKQRSIATFESIIQAIDENPVAIYFDWTHGSIDGRPADLELVEFFGQLRHHGFNGAINAVEKLMNFIFWKSSRGWK